MLDLILGSIIIFFIFTGIYKGLVREVFGFLSLLLGLYFAFQYMSGLSALLLDLIPSIPPWLLPPLSFILIFVVIILIARFLAKLLTKILSWVMLGWLNRIGGGAIGLLKGLILASIISLILGFISTPIPTLSAAINESHVYPLVLNVAPMTYEILTSILPEGKKTLDELKEKIPEFELPDALDQLKYLQELNPLTSTKNDSG